MKPEPLTDDYLAECEQRARRFGGAYTGTSGDLAARLILCVLELRRIRAEHEVAIGILSDLRSMAFGEPADPDEDD